MEMSVGNVNILLAWNDFSLQCIGSVVVHHDGTLVDCFAHFEGHPRADLANRSDGDALLDEYRCLLLSDRVSESFFHDSSRSSARAIQTRRHRGKKTRQGLHRYDAACGTPCRNMRVLSVQSLLLQLYVIFIAPKPRNFLESETNRSLAAGCTLKTQGDIVFLQPPSGAPSSKRQIP